MSATSQSVAAVLFDWRLDSDSSLCTTLRTLQITLIWLIPLRSGYSRATSANSSSVKWVSQLTVQLTEIGATGP